MKITTKPLTFKDAKKILRNGDHTRSIFVAATLEEIQEATDLFGLFEPYIGEDDEDMVQEFQVISCKPIKVVDDKVIIEIRFDFFFT